MKRGLHMGLVSELFNKSILSATEGSIELGGVERAWGWALLRPPPSFTHGPFALRYSDLSEK